LNGEFRKRIEILGLDEQTAKKIIDLIKEAGAEFPCLACPSTGIHLSFYPCLLVGRLGVSNDYRKSGVGKYMLKWCVGMALDLSDTVGCRYISLETKESKNAFYSKCNFHKGTVLDSDRYIWMYQKIAFE
jgi:GNAT superfamily N-acetyltransferase